ncbi:MAG: hypothetical protein HQL16_04825 [Candidatus Omnitrophica bacterium]|nr:hypothetical protein [Candidatus Omnitrophota bacterium]
MEFDKTGKFMAVTFIISGFLSGCVASQAATEKISSTSIYEEGYRKGVSENLGAMVEKLNGNDFPYIAGTWSAPVVQEVSVPAHVHGGIFYPEHNELVIITPGEWKRNAAFPISSNRDKNIPIENKAVRVEAPVVDITSLPSQNGKPSKGE